MDAKTFINYCKKNKINIIATNLATKSPLTSWKEYQHREMNDYDFDRIFHNFNPKINGIALITGEIAKFECIDFDNKHKDIDIWAILKEIVAKCEEFKHKLYIEKTQNGGYHILYRYPKPQGNQKLATKTINSYPYCFIETRGEGGYVIIAPSEGYAAITELGTSANFLELDELDEEEREAILSFCIQYNKARQKTQNIYHNGQKYASEIKDGENVFSVYNSSIEGMEYASSILERHGWKKYKQNKYGLYDYTRPGKREGVSGGWIREDGVYFFKVFTISTNLDTSHCYTPIALIAALEFNSDVSKAARHLIKEGQIILNQPKTIEEKTVLFFEIRKSIDINMYKLLEYLEQQNYKRYTEENNPEAIILVKLENNVAKIITKNDIDVFLGNVAKNLGEDYFNVYQKKAEKIRSDSFLAKLPVITKNDFIDTLNSNTNICFLDCVVEITKDKVNILQYKDIKKYVWERQIINQDFSPLQLYYTYSNIYDEYEKEIKNQLENEKYFTVAVDGKEKKTLARGIEKNNFLHFIKAVTAKTDEDNETFELSDKNFNSIITAIGYLLDGTPRPDGEKIVIFSDRVKTENIGIADGRRGKSLLFNMLSMLTNVTKIGGKLLEWNRFIFQNVSIDTKIVMLDDVDKQFDIQKLYNIATGFITIEKKGHQAITIPSPKFAITTNYIQKDYSPSTMARIYEVYFSDFFNSSYTPYEHFGKYFITDWNNKDFADFFFTIFYSIMYYKRNGFKASSEYENKVLHTLIVNTGITSEEAEYFIDIANKETEVTYQEIFTELENILESKNYVEKNYSFKRIDAICKLVSKLLNKNLYKTRVRRKTNEGMKYVTELRFNSK